MVYLEKMQGEVPAPRNQTNDKMASLDRAQGPRAEEAATVTERRAPTMELHRPPSPTLPTIMEKEGKAPQGAADQHTRQDYKLVTFAEGDPENPKNWSKAFKWYSTMVVALTCFVVAFCSSVITADIDSVAREFNVSHEVALVTITVFVVGFGVGEFQFSLRRQLPFLS
jgi:Ca2+/H+ antiporter